MPTGVLSCLQVGELNIVWRINETKESRHLIDMTNYFCLVSIKSLRSQKGGPILSVCGLSKLVGLLCPKANVHTSHILKYDRWMTVGWWLVHIELAEQFTTKDFRRSDDSYDGRIVDEVGISFFVHSFSGCFSSTREKLVRLSTGRNRNRPISDWGTNCKNDVFQPENCPFDEKPPIFCLVIFHQSNSLLRKGYHFIIVITI